eukprot:2054716-Rhodomonas_salina.1
MTSQEARQNAARESRTQPGADLERGSVALEDLGHRRIRVCDPYLTTRSIALRTHASPTT